MEPREFGGTCALRGCNPKKLFTNAAALIDQYQRASGRLTRGRDLRIDWSDLLAFQHEFTAPVRESTEDDLQRRGITTVHGAAQFESEHVISVNNTLLEVKNIFIGVGARPTALTIPGNELAVTSDDFMELPSLPSQILFLGGGFISFEFAHFATFAGCTVQILDRNELPLKSFDPDLVRLLLKCSAEAGIETFTGSEATSIDRRNGRLEVTFRTCRGEERLSSDLIVHGGGRVPNLDGMKLAAGRVAHSKRGVAVNSFLQSTTNAAVYAAGDCADTGMQMLTPTADASARVAAANMLAGPNQTQQSADYGPIAQVVFSVPPLAAVGLSELEAREQGFNFYVRFQDLSTKGEVRKLCAASAGCKLIIDRQTDRLLGAHILGPYADAVINLFALAIRFNLTTADLRSTLFAYPTMTAEYCRVL